MCTRARPYGRAGRCGFGGQGVTEGNGVNDATYRQKEGGSC
jgi:hypothetical protein